MKFRILLILGLTLIPTWACSENSEKSLQPVGEEAFEAIRGFYDYDKEIPLDGRIVERKEIDADTEQSSAQVASIRDKILFRGVRGFWVPGHLEIPNGGKAPYPVVLLLHGWSGAKQNWWEDNNYISGGNMRKALLAGGYAVCALDAAAHGDRIAENDYAPVNIYNATDGTARKNYHTLMDILVQTIRDYRRGLDYLETRPDIDTSRIGIVGYSMGGNQAFLLPAVDERVKVIVSCVVPSDVGGWDMAGVATHNFAPRLEGRAVLMCMGKEDGFYTHEKAERIHELIPSEEKSLIWYEAGHKLPVDWVADALSWIEDHL